MALAQRQSRLLSRLPGSPREKSQVVDAALKEVFEPVFEAALESPQRQAVEYWLGVYSFRMTEIGAVTSLRNMGFPAISRRVRDMEKKQVVQKAAGDVLFELSDAELAASLDDRAVLVGSSTATSTVEATRRTVRDTVILGGGSTQDAGNAIAAGGFPQWKADQLARTEMHAAYEGAQNATHKRSGVKKHSWVTVGDRRVRPSHSDNEAAGAIILGAFFPSGQRHPGEGAGSISCRCSTQPELSDPSIVLEPWNGSAGSGVLLPPSPVPVIPTTAVLPKSGNSLTRFVVTPDKADAWVADSQYTKRLTHRTNDATTKAKLMADGLEFEGRHIGAQSWQGGGVYASPTSNPNFGNFEINFVVKSKKPFIGNVAQIETKVAQLEATLEVPVLRMPDGVIVKDAQGKAMRVWPSPQHKLEALRKAWIDDGWDLMVMRQEGAADVVQILESRTMRIIQPKPPVNTALKVPANTTARVTAHMESVNLTELERRALDKYGTSSFSSVNKSLRTAAKASATDVEVIQGIDSVMARAGIPDDVKAYRGFRQKAGQSKIIPDDVKVGFQFSDDAYVSTSLDREVAFDRGGFTKRGIVIETEVPQGTKALYLKGEEFELLLDRGTKFVVTKVTELPSGAKLLKVRIKAPAKPALKPKPKLTIKPKPVDPDTIPLTNAKGRPAPAYKLVQQRNKLIAAGKDVTLVDEALVTRRAQEAKLSAELKAAKAAKAKIKKDAAKAKRAALQAEKEGLGIKKGKEVRKELETILADNKAGVAALDKDIAKTLAEIEKLAAKGATLQDTAAIEKAYAKRQVLAKKTAKLQGKRRALLDGQAKQIDDSLNLPASRRGTVDKVLKADVAADTQIIEEGVAKFEALVDKDVIPTRKLTFQRPKPLPGDDILRRESSYYFFNKVSLTPGAGRGINTVVHEMGHWVEGETANKAAKQKIVALLKKRTKGTIAKHLGSGYGPAETYFPTAKGQTKWIKNYMGKAYGTTGATTTAGMHVSATELLSMGLEMYATDPLLLMAKDPELFELIVNIARGHL